MAAIKDIEVPLLENLSYDTSLITKSISAGLSVIDKNMHIVWANNIQQEWFGQLNDIRGRHCYEIYQKRSRICPNCPTAKVFRYGCDTCTSIQKGILAGTDIKKYFKLTTSPIRNQEGSIVQVLELVEDVTEERRIGQKLRQELKSISGELNFLSKLNKNYTSSQGLSLENILNQSVAIAQALVKAKACNLRLIQGSEKILTTRTSSGLSKNYIKSVDLKIGEGVAGKVAQDKKPLIISDLSACKYVKFGNELKKENLHSTVCVPLLLKNEVLGTLSAYNTKIGQFTKGDARILSCFANHLAILIDNIATHKEVTNAYINTIKSLVSAIEARDPYTRGHSEKVTQFSLEIGSVLNLSEDNRLLLMYCGRLHDIGKVAIPDAILNKPGPLTVAERAEIQLHPAKGAHILSNLKFLEEGIPAIRHHHERYDGKGYPDGLKGKDIPLLARIITCADSFDAMTSDRAYRPKMDSENAIKQIKENRNRQFDPEIADAFVNLLRLKR